MGALQEARFYVIIGVIMLISILGYFFTLQNNVGYTDYSTSLKTTYADIKANASTTKTLKDVVTIDNKTVREMKNNQLFGLTVEGFPTEFPVLDNYTSGTNINLVKSNSGKIKLAFLLTDDVDGAATVTASEGLVNNESILTASGVTTTNSTLNDLSSKTSSIARGWTLDSNGYIAYIFSDESTAKDIMSNYLPNGTLVKVSQGTGETGVGVSAAVVVPFTSK